MRNLNHINDAGRNTNTPAMQLNAADAFPTRMRFKTNGNSSCFTVHFALTKIKLFKVKFSILEMKNKITDEPSTPWINVYNTIKQITKRHSLQTAHNRDPPRVTRTWKLCKASRLWEIAIFIIIKQMTTRACNALAFCNYSRLRRFRSPWMHKIACKNEKQRAH
jgi:hypothetical protein